MKAVEHDVYLCCREDGDPGMVSDVAGGLARLGFRVMVAGRDAAAAGGAGRLEAIGHSPDFVLLSSPSAQGRAEGATNPRAADLAHAFKTRRNILVLADPGHADTLATADLPGRPALAAWQRVAYDRRRTRESIALVAHRLVSSSEVEDRRFMRAVKRAAVTVALMLAVAVALRAVPAAMHWWNRPKAPLPLPRFTVYWTAFGQRQQGGTWTSFPVVDGSTVAAGDQLRLTFSAGSDGYAYVVARDSEGELSLLFPGATVRGASRVRAGARHDAPGTGSWFTVDARAGLAAIYLVAGHDPLENLEELAEEAEERMSPAARLDLLSSTIAGLLDGKHAAVPRPIRTRMGREIVDSLAPAPQPADWSATLASGASVTNRPAAQTGLLSAVVEIRLRSQAQQ